MIVNHHHIQTFRDMIHEHLSSDVLVLCRHVLYDIEDGILVYMTSPRSSSATPDVEDFWLGVVDIVMELFRTNSRTRV